jgi:hypothetical protein
VKLTPKIILKYKENIKKYKLGILEREILRKLRIITVKLLMNKD